MKNNMKISQKSNILKNIFAILSGVCLFMTTSPIAGTVYAEMNEMCLFSKQLQSSPMREQYIASLAKNSNTLLAYNTIADNQVQSDALDELTYSVFSFDSNGSSLDQADSIDSYSRNCLTCHDGHASNITINYKNAPGIKMHKSYNGTKEHPIGMNYASYAAMDPTSYKPANNFNSKMIFVNGRVGCLTCHNPLNPEKSHLVMSDFHSALCLTCHNNK